MITDEDVKFMELALAEARLAKDKNEVPVGAVVVLLANAGDKAGETGESKVISKAHNLRETSSSPLAHAELLATEQAAAKLGRWRLSDCVLYVTLEPCVMCAGAIVQARYKRVVYGAKDPKGGAVESLYQVLADARLNHRPEVLGGVKAEESGQLLKDFFAGLRKRE